MSDVQAMKETCRLQIDKVSKTIRGNSLLEASIFRSLKLLKKHDSCGVVNDVIMLPMYICMLDIIIIMDVSHNGALLYLSLIVKTSRQHGALSMSAMMLARAHAQYS